MLLEKDVSVNLWGFKKGFFFFNKRKLGLGFAPSLLFSNHNKSPGFFKMVVMGKGSHEKALLLLEAGKGYSLMFSISEH